MPVNLYEAVWIFLIYAFIGWCCEVAFAAVNKGVFVNRGFLNGPVCPIYGVGMLIVITALWPLRGNVIIMFLASALLTTLLELVTGFVLEKFFHEKWWDYSDMPFNIKGYVCLKFSILWGLAATFAVGAVHKFIYFVIHRTPFKIGIVLLIIFAVTFITDFIITLVELLKLPKKLDSMLELEKLLNSLSNSIGENISETTIAAAAKGSELIEEKKPRLDELKLSYEKKKEELESKKAEFQKMAHDRNIVHRRIVAAFPRPKSGKYKAVFDRINELKSAGRERQENGKD